MRSRFINSDQTIDDVASNIVQISNKFMGSQLFFPYGVEIVRSDIVAWIGNTMCDKERWHEELKQYHQHTRHWEKLVRGSYHIGRSVCTDVVEGRGLHSQEYRFVVDIINFAYISRILESVPHLLQPELLLGPENYKITTYLIGCGFFGKNEREEELEESYDDYIPRHFDLLK